MEKLYTLDDLTAAERKKILPHLQQAIKLALGTYHDYPLSEVPKNAIQHGFCVQLQGYSGAWRGWYAFPADTSWRAGIEYIDAIVRLCKAPRTKSVGMTTWPLYRNSAGLDLPIQRGRWSPQEWWLYFNEGAPVNWNYRQALSFFGGIAPSGKSYGLRVMNALDNTPIQGALVTANTFSGHTDSHGWFYFTGPAPASYPYNIAYITITAPGYVGKSFEYTRPNPTVKLQPASPVVHKGIALTFHVIDQATQKPITGARIAVDNTSFSGIKPQGATSVLTTDSNGNAHIYNAGKQTRVAKVTKQGYQVATVEVPVTGSKMVNITLHRLQGNEVLAQVPDPIWLGTAPDYGVPVTKYYITVKDAKTGTPISGATVLATGEVSASTDSHGNAVLQYGYHRPANIVIRVSKDGYEPVITAAAGRSGTGGYRCCDHLTFALSPVPVPKMSTVGGTTGIPTGFFRSTAGRIVLWGGAAIILYWAIKKR